MAYGGQVDRYLAVTVLRSIAVVLICLLTVVTLFTIVDELSDITPGYTEAHALLYVLYSTPRRLSEVVPYGVFIGTLVGLGVLASHSELTVLRSVGVSLGRLFASTAVAALVVLAGNVALSEFAASVAEDAANTLKLRVARGDASGAIDSTTWYRDGEVHHERGRILGRRCVGRNPSIRRRGRAIARQPPCRRRRVRPRYGPVAPRECRRDALPRWRDRGSSRRCDGLGEWHGTGVVERQGAVRSGQAVTSRPAVSH